MDAFNRRQFLAAGSAAAAICLTGQAAAAEAMAIVPRDQVMVGMNTTVLGDAVAKNLDQTLQALAHIGYQLIEFSGFGQWTGKDLRLALDRARLNCATVYVTGIPGAPGLSLTGDLDKLAEQAHALGVEYIVLPFPVIPSRFSLQPQHGENRVQRLVDVMHQLTVDDWKAAAAFLNEKGAALKRRGLQLGYHNHNVEFMPVGAGTGYDMLLTGTDPDLVSFELDAGWALSSGHDPVTLLQAHPGRFHLMSVKDFAATTPPNTSLDIHLTPIGDGIVDWRQVLPIAYAAGIRRFFVDLDPPFDRPIIDVLRRSYDYLDRLMT